MTHQDPLYAADRAAVLALSLWLHDGANPPAHVPTSYVAELYPYDPEHVIDRLAARFGTRRWRWTGFGQDDRQELLRNLCAAGQLAWRLVMRRHNVEAAVSRDGTLAANRLKTVCEAQDLVAPLDQLLPVTTLIYYLNVPEIFFGERPHLMPKTPYEDVDVKLMREAWEQFVTVFERI